MKKLLIAASMSFGLLVALPLTAETGTQMSDGEVRRLTEDRVTLRHGPIDNLKMPPMTMVFRVALPDQLEGLEVGDSVRFRAEQDGGSYVVTEIQKAAD
jgi:Cu(I)/Ag(I) efflux system periplasmic protein CusF